MLLKVLRRFPEALRALDHFSNLFSTISTRSSRTSVSAPCSSPYLAPLDATSELLEPLKYFSSPHGVLSKCAY